MRQALAAGGQVMLLLNRRGFSTHVHCPACGYVDFCRFCDLAMTYHRERAVTLLQDVGLAHLADTPVGRLSRGQQQRVTIARALLHEPSVLLLDEPATGLDPQGVNWLAETVQRLRKAGSTILMSLHGESEISALATRAIRLDAGTVVADTQNGASLRSILTFADA